MFKIESYVTPILLSYVDKYVKDFKPADAQVSLWGGGVALHNLVLKADVLQQEVALPFTLVSGRIHELLIQVPWTKIMSEPIIVTIDTIECVLSLNPPTPSEESPPPESPSRKTQLVEAPPGYMQALVRRIVSNIALRVHHLIVKYVQDDIVMSFNVKHVAVDSAGSDWEPAFADIDQNLPIIRRLVCLDDLTLCLDRTDSDGKIRFYQEPLLYKCQLYLRVLTRLVSANTRRASSLSVQLRSSKLAWSVTSDQLTLLLRLFRERTAVDKPPPPVPKQPSVSHIPLHPTSSNSAEPARSESWSEWAWSWLPTWMDREGGVEEAPMPATPIPVHFSAYLDDVSLVFKVMELDSGNRKRSRGVLEMSANYAALKSYICAPTVLRVRFATRALTVLSHGKCACGHLNYYAANDEPSVYLKRADKDEKEVLWKWPEAEFNDDVVETAEVAQEGDRDTPETDPDSLTQNMDPSDHGLPEEPSSDPKEPREDVDALWQQMGPVVYVEYTHERSPPHIYINPYENPPPDFQHSDWVEECNMKVQIEPMEMKLCTGLLHRLAALRSICAELPPVPDIELPMKVLTVEECEALCDNLPQRRIAIEAKGFHLRVLPWDHAPSERSLPSPLVLDVLLPKTTMVITGPLYPHRVCSAACQMPDDAGPLWQGARLHVTVGVSRAQVGVRAGAPADDAPPRPCARSDLRLVMHLLLHKHYFTKRESIIFSYSLKIREANLCGSQARLLAAYHILMSLNKERASLPLRHSTLTKDALNDEEAVAVDVTVEDLGMRGFITKNMNTHIISMHSARGTALHEPKGGELKQAWLFCAPDTPTTSPYLRVALQWCSTPIPTGLDYLGVWMEPTALCVDPLFIAWLAYKPQLKSIISEPQSLILTKSASSTQYFLRRRATPPSSSGRGVSRSGSGADMVHVRPRSVGSSSEPSEKKDKNPPRNTKPAESWWSDDKLLALHSRMQRMLINVESGLVLVYVTMTTASAIDCVTVRDAMERHASDLQDVLAMSLGRLLMHSSSVTKHLWHEIRHDGPTFTSGRPDPKNQGPDSFPWKIRLADVSCYTLEVRTSERFPREKSSSGLRSQLKIPCVTAPRTVLELVTTTITLSVVTKSLQLKTMVKKDIKKHTSANVDESRVKYFKAGMDFKPATLKEFVRGPAKRKKPSDQVEQKIEPPPRADTTQGPVVSLGIHLHADTPPIIVRLEYDQVHIVAATVHCFKHILNLLQRAPLTLPRHGYTSLGSSHRSLIRSVSELEELQSPSDDTISENRSELISIFEAHSAIETTMKLKTFFWFQWVVSRATLVVATHHAKLAFDVDDIISTVDLQSHYNQLRIKVASASVRHFERIGGDEWTAGVLGGRVLEAREPTNAKEENNFLTVTITQAQISNLPPSWKEELHPKLLEHKSGVDSMWEIYATLAPLEAVLRPIVVEHIVSLFQEMAPRSFCPLQAEVETRPAAWQWPFCYVTAGGLRLLLTCEEEDTSTDDTFMFVVGKISVNPHPENPICRRGVNAATESGWSSSSGSFEGRQYEVLVNNVAIRSAHFSQIVNQEESEREMLKGIGGENPALKWSQPVISPAITPVLHSMDIGCVLAPALYTGGVLSCGPAVELNLVTDCAVELSINQLDLVRRLVTDVYNAIVEGQDTGEIFDEEKHSICPYASLLMNREADEPLFTFSDATVIDDPPKEAIKIPSDSTRLLGADSGVDTNSQSTFKSGKNFEDIPMTTKKSVSIAFVEQMAEASEFLEVFVTIGTVELSLYTADDGSAEIADLRPPTFDRPKTPEAPVQKVVIEETRDPAPKKEDMDSSGGTRSITENVRNVEMRKVKLELMTVMPPARKSEGNLPLLHITLQQPNFYYWKKKSQKTIQFSLFNAWVGLGMGQLEGQWHKVLLSTAKGVPDPVTDIKPALATMKIVAPVGGLSNLPSTTTNTEKGTVKLDLERPVLLEVCTDRLRRIRGIYTLIKKKVWNHLDYEDPGPHGIPALYKMRKMIVQQGLESITLQTSQVALSSVEGTVGWDSATLQAAAGPRPERLVARASLTALLVARGSPGDRRHVLMQPLTMGAEIEASWEAWRRAEGGLSAYDPSVRVGLELDYVIFDFRPADLSALIRIQKAIDEMTERKVVGSRRPAPGTSASSETIYKNRLQNTPSSVMNFDRHSSGSVDTGNWDGGDHYYKDDLRSGAFKIVSGGQLPMAYQVMLHGSSVSWRYPHPRAITRVIVFPLPDQNTETECVLEFYSPMLSNWEIHTTFKLPVGEPTELQLQVVPPEAVFAQMWRFRALFNADPEDPPFEFQINKFTPRAEPLTPNAPPEPLNGRKTEYGVTAEQLSGVLRVDSYFAPRLLPRMILVVRLASLEVHVHNSLPFLTSQATALEGYYVSRPLMRSHRVLTVLARDSTAHAQLGSPAGTLFLLDTKISSDILESTSGAMERLVDEFSGHLGLSIPSENHQNMRVRVRAGDIRVSLLVPRLRTLHALAADWMPVVDQYVQGSLSLCAIERMGENVMTKRELAAAAAAALEGRVSLWIHNSCASALRIGQEGTDEVVPLGPGARLAYRWRNPTAAKKIRFAFAGPTTDWRWSNSIPFTAGSARVRLEEPEPHGNTKNAPGAGVFVHSKIEETGARRCLHLAGRLVLANMLRFDLLYKVRARCLDSNEWHTVCSGELTSETVGRSVLCGAECEMVLKVKLMSHDSGWSGDIPLKECPKENVPWLVKMPADGEVPYMSVWCRVVRARSDGRILATVWPLYVLHSHLPLDTDVLISTETALSMTQLENEHIRPSPIIQTTPGRGTSTHLLAPGTTSARHNLSFQYRNIDCPVTREVVPLHYGVTDTSVFDKRTPVNSIDEVIEDILQWLKKSSRSAVSSWPYSVVANHCLGVWQPALLQPRCDVTVRYQAVRAGGGCCLEIQLCPVVLLCNATPMALTLRAHDAAPLCKLEPGSAISPPSAVLKKPLFMSVEMGRETFVSGQLTVSAEEPGRYGAPPPGHVTLDHTADFAIQCNQKVALMTMYYEIKEDINVLGVSSTYVLLNRLETDILVSAVAVPCEAEDISVLRPKTFKMIPPTKEDSTHGIPLCRFWLRGRWRGGDPGELRTYLCLALPAGAYPASAPVPVRLDVAPGRRPLALRDDANNSIAIVVTQVKHEGRCLIAINKDPCPQFVVQNQSRGSLMVAQPLHINDEPSTSAILAATECAGTKWWCEVQPDTMTHYSSPAHCERYPPPRHAAPHTTQVPFLTFSKAREKGDPDWCQPVAVTDGEQLVQLSGGDTIKMRVRTHPHSTHIELHDVDERDISASDIRRRLFGAVSSDYSAKSLLDDDHTPPMSGHLERTDADAKLIKRAVNMEQGTAPDGPEELPSPAKSVQTSPPRPSGLDDPDSGKNSVATMLLYPDVEELQGAQPADESEETTEAAPDTISTEAASYVLHQGVQQSDWEEDGAMWTATERLRCVVASIMVSLASSTDVLPLLALHVDRAALLVLTDSKRTKTILSVADVQVDNLKYETGQYDFAVVASTHTEGSTHEQSPTPLWTMFAEKDAFATRHANARLLLRLQYDKWNVVRYHYQELTEVDIRVGPLAVYVEDAYVTALVELARLALPPAPASDAALALAEERSLAAPLRVRTLLIHPLDLTLTLHTAVRMYIALDQSPLRLSAFKLHDVMTSTERLTHALTVHYLSAAILGAGWVVGGLELLGAPGALAARVGSATGGVRGVASAAAAALLRSLSAWAGSLARNLDLLAGDEEHARRAAAARRRPPPSLMAGLVAGITNFAINILGAVGGLAHHPLVGVAVGETESGAAALRRGLIGALTKPLSATADLVAYAGHGLLSQTGWDPVPQPRSTRSSNEESGSGWRRDSVRWTFRLADLTALAGFEVLLDNAPLQLLLTHKFLVVADPELERIVEMIDLRYCSLGPYQGPIIELVVTQRRQSKLPETRAVDDDDEYQISAAAMARVARYTGAEGAGAGAGGGAGAGAGAEARVLSLLPLPGRSHALHAALAAALHHNADSHFALL